MCFVATNHLYFNDHDETNFLTFDVLACFWLVELLNLVFFLFVFVSISARPIRRALDQNYSIP